MSNKWTLNIKTSYSCGDETITRTHVIAIPPTKGNRIDVLGTSGKYYYGMTKKKWSEKMTPEDYLNQNLKVRDPKEREKVLKNITWTPRLIDDEIETIIHIKNGEITLKTKF